MGEERGSVLVLLPAMTLVAMLLSAIAVDQAEVLATQRRLVAVAESMANDAAAYGIDETSVQAGRPTYEPRRIERLVRLESALADVDLAEPPAVAVRDDVVTVRLATSVPPLFGRIVGASPRRVLATASARLRES